jgi:hypothetical protein
MKLRERKGKWIFSEKDRTAYSLNYNPAVFYIFNL